LPLAWSRRQAQRERMVVEQQRIGAGVVRLERRAVELGGVERPRLEAAMVQHQVAADLAYALLAKLAQEQPQALHVEARVAAAADDEVAFEDVAALRAGRIGAGFPGIGRPQQLQRGLRRHQLQRGRGIERRQRVRRHQRAARDDFLRIGADGARRYAGVAQCLGHAGRQFLRGCAAAGKNQDNGGLESE
jgi:hypothetical protein